jgi:hypothetical protein
MSLHKLTTRELEERIDQFRDRALTLKDIIKDIKDPNAKKTLLIHMSNYQTSLDSLRAELEKRNSK